jgi:hypothetical protein
VTLAAIILLVAAAALAFALWLADRALAGTQGAIDSIAYAAQHPATGWYDPAAFEARVERTLAWAQRHELPVSFVVLRWYGGERSGSQRVAQLANLLVPGAFVVELGEREAALVYPGLDLARIRRLLHVATRAWDPSGTRTFDLGFASAPSDGATASGLLLSARRSSRAWQDWPAPDSPAPLTHA